MLPLYSSSEEFLNVGRASDENSAVSPEDIKAGEVLLSIPLPALVTRYFVSLKLTELESFQCVLLSRAALLQTHPYSLGPHLSTQVH